jgi:hypothetical protein
MFSKLNLPSASVNTPETIDESLRFRSLTATYSIG